MFLGGLAEETTEKDLKAAFAEFGTIVDCKVMRDNDSGKSRGFGFVTYSSSFMTEAAIEKSPFEINGKEVTPKRAPPHVARCDSSKISICYPILQILNFAVSELLLFAGLNRRP